MSSLKLLLSALMVMLLAGFCCISSAQTLTLQQYSDALSKVEAVAQPAASGASTSGANAITALQPIVRCTVKTNSGDLVFVDNRPLLVRMESAEHESKRDAFQSDWACVVDQISRLKSSLNVENPLPPTSVKAGVSSVLLRPDFASQPLAGKTLWDKIGDDIAKWWEDLMKKFHWKFPDMPAGRVSPAIPEAILIVIAVVAVGMAIYYIVLWVRNRADDNALRNRPESGIALTLEEEELVASHNYTRLRDLAQEAADRGDYRPAFRLMFLATLVMLDFEGIIRLDRSKTNWEYLRFVASDSAILAPMQPFVRDFDGIWYGNRTADEASFRNAQSHYETIRAIISERLAQVKQTAPQTGRLARSTR